MGGGPNKKPQSDARYSSAPLRLLIRLSLRAAHDFQSLSVIFKHLREAGRILAQRLNRVKKKSLSDRYEGVIKIWDKPRDRIPPRRSGWIVQVQPTNELERLSSFFFFLAARGKNDNNVIRRALSVRLDLNNPPTAETV